MSPDRLRDRLTDYIARLDRIADHLDDDDGDPQAGAAVARLAYELHELRAELDRAALRTPGGRVASF